jgi:hypothetical protein
LKGGRFMIRKSVYEEGKKIVYVCMCIIHKPRMCANKKTWKNTMCSK